MRAELPFIFGIIYELAPIVVAVGWGWLFHRNILEGFAWSLKAAGIGMVAAMPPFVFFLWSLSSKRSLWVRHQELMNALVYRLFSHWSLPQLLAISICAGISEETLFRGAIQGGLAERTGMIPALILASLAFGASHLLTWTYSIIAAVIGLYLGLVWVWTGNLLAPMVTHALYDFLALAYFLKWRRHV